MNKRVLLYDCELITGGSRFFNDLTLRISSYHKQLKDKVIVAKSRDVLNLSYDIIYVIKEKDFSITPPMWVIESKNTIVFGEAGDFFPQYQKVPNIIYSVRPDYLLLIDDISKTTRWERTEFITFYNENFELPLVQNHKNFFNKKNILMVTDKNFWDFSDDKIIEKLNILLQYKNIIFKYPIKIKPILLNEKIQTIFKELSFDKVYKNTFVNNYGDNQEDIFKIIDFLADFSKYNCFKPVKIRSFRKETTDLSTAREEFFRSLKILGYSKRKKVRINLTCSKYRTNSYWDYFTILKKAAASNKKCFLDIALYYAIKNRPNSTYEAIINNKLEWFSYYTRIAVSLLSRYKETIYDDLSIRWGEDKLILNIDFNYLERNAI